MTEKSNLQLSDIGDQEIWKVLVVDDDIDVHTVTKMVLNKFTFEDQPIEILTAYSAREAEKILEDNNNIAVGFIDVVMESDDAGLKLVEYIRHVLGNIEMQIILRTGQPGMVPEEMTIREYGINDYLNKAELSVARLTTSLVTALRAYRYITIAKHNQQEKNIAEAATKAKSKFLAHMSHEIRTPVNAVVGLTDMLLRTELNSIQRDYADTIKSSGKLLVNILNDILDFSKIEAGKLPLENIVFDLAAIIREVSVLFKPQVAAAKLQLNISMENNVPQFIVGDPTRLQQILINLISNAIKFTKWGSINVRLLNKGIEGSRIAIEGVVEDTGIGISEENLPKLFKSYSQAEASTSRKYGGTGLGLEIVKNLCELMEGTITVTSELGVGTTFRFNIHFGICDDMSDQEKLKSGNVAITSRQLSILLVEDNPINRIVTLDILERLGHEVGIAENGLEAIGEFRQKSYDLVFMDCEMPILDGYEATRIIRSLDSGKDVPIIALTANMLDSDHEECVKCGMSDFVSKPLEAPGIDKILTKWIKN